MKHLSTKFKVKCSMVLILAMIASLLPPPMNVLAAEINAPDKSAWLPYEKYLNSDTAKKEDMRATWIVTVYNSDWPSSDSLKITDTEERVKKQQEELCNILDAASLSNLNAVMFQVRTASDALYKSELVPWSTVLTGTPGGDPGFDPLEFAIEEAHRRGLELHAWFNPYRAATAVNDAMVEQLKGVPKSVFNTHFDWIKKCNDGVYAVDPGIPEVRSWVEDCVMEVVNKYDVDGVHFDDYFYHEGTAYDYDDKATFAKYNEGFTNIGDWRRNNTYKLISELSQKIREEKPWVKFGVSPAGMWGNIKDGHANGSPTAGGAPNYDRAFADTLRWANEGLIDYLCPQVYWPFGRDVAPYGVISTWWSDHITNQNTKLYMGMGLYRVNGTSNSTETGFLDPYAKEEMIREIQLNTNYKSEITGHDIDGSFLYQSSNIVPNDARYKKEAVEEGIRKVWEHKAIAPKSTWKSNVAPLKPINVTVNPANEGVQVTWNSNDSIGITQYYTVYRFEKDETLNIEDPTKIIAVVGKDITTYIDKAISDPSKVKYAVTALDRLHNESSPSLVVNNTIKEEETTESSTGTENNADDTKDETETKNNDKITENSESKDSEEIIEESVKKDDNKSKEEEAKINSNEAINGSENKDNNETTKTSENNGDIEVKNNIVDANKENAKATEGNINKENSEITKDNERKGDTENTDSKVDINKDKDQIINDNENKDSDKLTQGSVSKEGKEVTDETKVVDIVRPVSADDVECSTAVGTAPRLPISVKVNMSTAETVTMMVKWEKITDKSIYKEVGAKFDVEGTVINSNGSPTEVKLKAHVSVLEPEIKYICPVVVETEQGIAPVFPNEVDVIYTNNKVKKVSVNWETPNPKDYEKASSLSDFKNPSVKGIFGTVDGTDLKAEGNYIVYPAVKEYELENIKTRVGIPPILPKEVKAIYSDDTSEMVNVTWNEVPKEDYSKVGTFTVEGTVKGVTLKVQVSVTVEKLVSISNIEKIYIKTGIGVAPKLPATVKVTYDDGTQDILPVTWPEINVPEKCASTHRFNVIGKINGTSTEVRATVEVASVIVLDNFEDGVVNGDCAESMIKWTGDSVSNTPPTLSYDTNVKHSGNSSLKIDYKLSKVSGTASAYVKPNRGKGIVFNKGEVPQKIGFWIYGNNVKTFALRAEFRSGTTVTSKNANQNIFGALDFNGWRYMEYPIDPSYSETGLCITLMPGIVATSSDKVDSAIYMDDLVAVYGNETKDITEINNAIEVAQSLYDNTVSGVANGEYPESERNGLKSSIEAAISVRDNSKATMADLYSATDLLNSAMDAYKASKVVTEQYQIIDDYEDHGSGKSMVQWISDGSNKPNISYNTDENYVKNGARSLRVDYKFEGTKGTVGAYVKGDSYPNKALKFTKKDTPNKIGFWLYGNDKPIYSLRIETRKADGSSVKNLNLLPSNSVMKAGWNFVTCDLSQAGINSETGLLLNILPGLVEISNAGRVNSTIYVDDITAIYNITPEVTIKKTELFGAIGLAKALLLGAEEGIQGGQYHKGAIENLNKVLIVSEGLIESNVQTDIDNGVKNLNEAIKVFKSLQIPLIDKPGLKAMIDEATLKEAAAVEGQKPGQYKEGTKKELKAAIVLAQAVYDNENATKDNVEETKTALRKAIEEFEGKVVPPLSTKNLDDEINHAKNLYEGAKAGSEPGQYPKKAIEDLKGAVDAAITGKANAEIQNDIDTCLKNLSNAIKTFESSMVPLKVDKSGILQTIENVQARVNSTLVGKLGGQYPQFARDEITTAILVAQGVVDNIHSEQKDIDSAIEKLEEAMDKYVKARIPAPWDKYDIPDEAPINKHEMRAAWVSTVVNIDWPSTDSWKIEDPIKRVEKQKTDLIEIFDYLEKEGCNAVMFQVRPTSDAFYKSKLVPWSYWLTGKQDVDPQFDPLQFAIDEAHKRNLELHAWVNPYRVSMPPALYKNEEGKPLENLNEVAEMLKKVPSSVYAKHPEWIKVASRRFVLDPGIPDAEKYVEDCIMEIVENYDVDGIHFDDYFYVGNNEGFDDGYSDQSTYDKYADKAKFPDIKDWRRNNTYTLIKNLHDRINSVKPWIKFGVSPAGVWGNKKDGHPDGSDTGAGIPNYDHAYADTKKWVLEEIIDYICPQVYWTFNNSAAPYGVVSSWWADLLKNNPTVKTQLYMGVGLYWLNPDDEVTSDPYWTTLGVGDQEIARQIKFNAANPDIDGTMIFTYNSFRANYPNAISAASLIKNDLWKSKALVPTMPWKGGVTPKAPEIIDVMSKDNGTVIRWNDSDKNTTYYAVYRVESANNIRSANNLQKLIATVRKNGTGIQSYVDTEGKLGDKYIITALNRLSDESTPSNEVTNSSNSGSNTGNFEIQYQKERLEGKDRFYTAVAIAEKLAPNKVKKVVITTGNDFADALSGSVLAKNFNAPILLVGSNAEENKATLDYIKKHLEKDGEIYILGGEKAVSNELVKAINALGFENIKRLSGTNRYDTCKLVNQELNIKKGTPVFIATGKDFADGLSIASIAAIKGYPILLTDNNSLPSQIEEMLKSIQPSKVYIVGGTSAVSKEVEKMIKSITNVLNENIIRFDGKGRYETSIMVAKHFNLQSDTVCFASGEKFPDAISGSILAAKYNAPIILIGNEVSMQKKYLDSITYRKQIIFGGKSAINSHIEKLIIK